MSQWFTRAWHEGHPALYLLWPLMLLFALVSGLRRQLYRARLCKTQDFPVPVIVVGNITVGGTGKTPLTLALIERLREEGFTPGVVSRGYGGHGDYPLIVNEEVIAEECGDEPLTLFRRTAVPLVVDPKRTRAVAHLLANSDCDVVLCDDGMQHYALARDIEIAVIDGVRGVGNGHLLPMGPLRESVSRLHSVQQIVINGEGFVWPSAVTMGLSAQDWQNMRREAHTAPVPGAHIHAVAGIGNPPRFFEQLRAQGYIVTEHAYPDHHVYSTRELSFGDGLPVVMTEKDAVKCMALAEANWWYVPVKAVLPEDFYATLLQGLQTARQKKMR
ncbi:MAG: tetraacyldisaccharide 4'-kinase [Moraxellaceae bacterium]